MIEFRNVCASYKEGATVLHGVNFKIEQGEFVAFVGTNGAGKSTTMRLMNGLIKPSSGEVLIDGTPTTQMRTSDLASRVGFLFQNPDRQICCPTVREELLFGFRALGRLDEEAKRKVDETIELFGFDPQAEPYLLNRGTRQLLALASTVVIEPEIVILDEPTTGLDFRECSKVMDMVSRLNARGTTVVMVCHDMEVVSDYAARVIAMTAGHVVADGPTFEILNDEEVLTRTDLIPPQIVELSHLLTESIQRTANAQTEHLTAVMQANTLDEMERALINATRTAPKQSEKIALTCSPCETGGF